MTGKAMPPFADNTRLNAYFLGDRTCAGAFGRQQHYLRPLQVALRRARGPAVRLKQLLFRPQPNFSCFGNHPDLTRKEKWVLTPYCKPDRRARTDFNDGRQVSKHPLFRRPQGDIGPRQVTMETYS